MFSGFYGLGVKIIYGEKEFNSTKPHYIIAYLLAHDQYANLLKILSERCVNFTLIQISKDEAILLRGTIKGISISRTMKGKSNRGKFFVEPTQKAIKMLKEIRNENYIER